MCRSKWKWPVTFPVALASSQTARQWTSSTMSRGSLSPISSDVMLFSKCGHLLTERPRACASAHVFFLWIFFLSQLQMSALCYTKQLSRVFWIPPGATEVICQPVTQSVGNVCFILLAERGELFANTAEATRCLRGRVKVERVITPGHGTVRGILLWCCYCGQRHPYLLQTAAKSHTYFQRTLPLIHSVLLQLATDSSA